jgi:hypothetical protein
MPCLTGHGCPGHTDRLAATLCPEKKNPGNPIGCFFFFFVAARVLRARRSCSLSGVPVTVSRFVAGLSRYHLVRANVLLSVACVVSKVIFVSLFLCGGCGAACGQHEGGQCMSGVSQFSSHTIWQHIDKWASPAVELPADAAGWACAVASRPTVLHVLCRCEYAGEMLLKYNSVMQVRN